MAAKVSVFNKPGIKRIRGVWHPVVNCWREGRIIACEVMSDKYVERSKALQAAKAHCATVDNIVRAALTPVMVAKQVEGEGDGSNEAPTL